jgi:hypothetical protein
MEVDEPIQTVTTDYYQRYKVDGVTSGPKHIGDAYQWIVTVEQWCSNGYWEPYLTSMVIENKDETLNYHWDVVVYQYAAGVGVAVSLTEPSTQGSQKKSNCTGAYQIPVI